MRLIDADALFRKVKTECNPYGKPTIGFEDGKRVMNWIEQAPTVSGWVSVKDRLPEHGKRYLIYATSEDNKIGHITTAAFGGHFALSGRCAHWKVTHWMPLPAPPKEVSDGNVH